ncbi:hypothetical protein [Bradyrhizobium sp. Cp5.3]|uniref:hypothetical protein n=1 Tax=Bradyrhizobium sp. Cp5.3 TaxID=443598 RepID=UPI001FD8DFCC|nr:hypothetical protein [Bradyrhizobium sp. Cp5.3]
MLAILLLGGCTSRDKPALSAQQITPPELLNTKEIDAATRERFAYALRGDVDEEALPDALNKQPDNVNAAIPLARALLARKCPDRALEVLDNVLLAAPSDLRILNAKGVVLDHEGRHHEAQALYRQALAMAPGNPMLTNNLKLSLALDEKDKAGSASLQPLSDSPNESVQ